ncbi:hypothetical protein [Enterococcus aquimarinus]|uniref:hypothetical protein n=1 Tax=Enterococcus aquimarinus TaxID=328396 RepID=UPI001B8012E7|nr:hypothetical protein [Enterococcus aquimarinus]
MLIYLSNEDNKVYYLKAINTGNQHQHLTLNLPSTISSANGEMLQSESVKAKNNLNFYG